MKRHGATVIDGEVQYLSVSSVEKARMCLRRWWYHYIQKIQEEQTDALARGTRIHAEIEKYLKTGVRPRDPDVLAGMHMIPEPGDDLLVEHDLAPDTLETAVLRADGIPFIGSIDLMHARGTNDGTMDIEEMMDAEGTITVGDWKSCKNLKWIKLGPELVETTQMSGYAKYAFDAVPEAKRVRLFHGYFPSQGLPRKTTALVDREQVERSWKRTEVLARSIRDAACETDPDKIEANTSSCRAFGRDCPARSVCTAGMQGSLAGAIATMSTGANNVTIPANGLLNRLTTKKVLPATEVSAKVAETPSPEQVAAERARLKLLDLLADIEALGIGLPAFAGEAAATISAARKQPLSGVGLAGTGELGVHTVEFSDTLEQILNEVRDIVAGRAAKTAAGAPAVDDAPEATRPIPFVPGTEPEPQALDAIAAKVDAPKRRGRPKKADVTPVEESASVEESATVEESAPVEESASYDAAETVTSAINVYVDCSTSFRTTPIWPLVSALVDKMNTASGAPDFRVADEKGQFGYGKWRGILTNLLRKEIGAGTYSLDNVAGEIAQAVAESLRFIAAKSGGVYVRGSR